MNRFAGSGISGNRGFSDRRSTAPKIERRYALKQGKAERLSISWLIGYGRL